MSQAYSDPKRESDPNALPDVETWHEPVRVVFNEERGEWMPSQTEEPDDAASVREPGWYWWSCFPGCLPDGEPNGPFETETEALADAQEGR